MRQELRRQITNIVFVALIVAAAVAIYLLSRTERAGESPSVQTVSAAASPTPTETAERQSASRGVPDAVFETYLATSEVFSAEREEGDERRYAIRYGTSPQVSAALRYETQDGCVSSVELTFSLPASYENKGNSEIEAYLSEVSQALERALPDAVRALLEDMLPACDAQDALTAASARYWAEQALQLSKAGDDFEDSLSGCRFLAYRSQNGDVQELVCVLFLS